MSSAVDIKQLPLCIFLPADAGSPGPGVQEDRQGGVRAGVPAAGPGPDGPTAGPRLFRSFGQQIQRAAA